MTSTSVIMAFIMANLSVVMLQVSIWRQWWRWRPPLSSWLSSWLTCLLLCYRYLSDDCDDDDVHLCHHGCDGDWPVCCYVTGIYLTTVMTMTSTSVIMAVMVIDLSVVMLQVSTWRLWWRWRPPLSAWLWWWFFCLLLCYRYLPDDSDDNDVHLCHHGFHHG